jgi:hypothetical protein
MSLLFSIYDEINLDNESWNSLWKAYNLGLLMIRAQNLNLFFLKRGGISSGFASSTFYKTCAYISCIRNDLILLLFAFTLWLVFCINCSLKYLIWASEPSWKNWNSLKSTIGSSLFTFLSKESFGFSLSTILFCFWYFFKFLSWFSLKSYLRYELFSDSIWCIETSLSKDLAILF